jgi:hypothetical protein
LYLIWLLPIKSSVVTSGIVTCGNVKLLFNHRSRWNSKLIILRHSGWSVKNLKVINVTCNPWVDSPHFIVPSLTRPFFLHVQPLSLHVTKHKRGMKLSMKRAVNTKQTPWLLSASELYGPSDFHLSEKLVPTFADRGCHMVSVTDPYGRILGFIDRCR